MAGLVGGLAVSTFSKTLAFFFGLIVFGAQVRSTLFCECSTMAQANVDCSYLKYAASKGYNIIPTTKFQRYIKGIDLRSAIEDNVAFKLSFGATFMLASFAELPTI